VGTRHPPPGTFRGVMALSYSSHGRLIAMMTAGNERNRYLPEVLEHLALWVDGIVAVDDGSVDGTGDFLARFPKVLDVVRNPQPVLPVNESVLRAMLWSAAVKTQPEWIVAVDADEIFEDRVAIELPWLLRHADFEVIAFRIFDFWGTRNHYRVDGAWNPWPRFSPLVVRYQEAREYHFPALEIHCGRVPWECRRSAFTYYADVRVRHLGWANQADHLKKYLFYREKDIRMYGRPTDHTESILAPASSVRLEAWSDAPPLSFAPDVQTRGAMP